MASPCEIRLRACGGIYFISHCDEGVIFHNLRSKLFHIRRKSNISLERIMKLCYNNAKKGGDFMAESKLRDLSMDFSVKVIKLCDSIKGHHSLVNQLERSATSIGANIHEANYARGKADFVARLQISLKECYETEYWIELFVKSDLIERETAKELYNQCGTIRRILITSINTEKESDHEKT